MLKRLGHALIAAGVALGFLLASAGAASAHESSGAIFTTLVNGDEVNFNHFDAKEDVYLDGGPGPGAPQEAAGLDDGTYVFMVTDPSGKDLLSTDPARCRQFTVSDGVIADVVIQPDGCEHATGTDVDHDAVTVQLFPFLDTTNNGGVYKVWVTFLADFPAECLATVDCTVQGKHGFLPGHSKTDNFKVGERPIIEIDTRFWQGNEVVDGYSITWTDTNGATNRKWSYWAPQLSVFHEAHVEAVEAGRHGITVADQPGCAIGEVWADGKYVGSGPMTVQVRVSNLNHDRTIWVDVDCL